MNPSLDLEVRAVVARVCCAVVALAAVAGVVVVRRDRRLRRRLVLARVEHRLEAGCLHRDLEVFRRRLEAVVVEGAVVAEADRVLDGALAAQVGESRPEGGPT